MLERVARIWGKPPRPVRRVVGGYTPAGRWIVEAPDGQRAFAKFGTTPDTARYLRDEALIYAKIEVSVQPLCIGFADDADHPTLVLEDLSDARWPPPWDEALVGEVRTALDTLHNQSPSGVPTFAQHHGEMTGGWAQVQQDPEPLLRLGLMSRHWLNQALPSLMAAERAVVISGDALCHFDVRSDNICRSNRGVLLIDYNFACLANADLDTGFWLPSLAAEGGPPPEAILPDAPEIASWVSGFFASQAGGPPIPGAPQVRAIQLVQLGPALSWAARAIGLPIPG